MWKNIALHKHKNAISPRKKGTRQYKQENSTASTKFPKSFFLEWKVWNTAETLHRTRHLLLWHPITNVSLKLKKIWTSHKILQGPQVASPTKNYNTHQCNIIKWDLIGQSTQTALYMTMLMMTRATYVENYSPLSLTMHKNSWKIPFLLISLHKDIQSS